MRQRQCHALLIAFSFLVFFASILPLLSTCRLFLRISAELADKGSLEESYYRQNLETSSSRKDDSDHKVQEYCKAGGSLNEIVFKTANYSSPPESASYKKTASILGQANSFHIDLRAPIFVDVTVNIATMLKGAGLKQVKAPSGRHDEILIGSTGGRRSCPGNCTALPLIIIQTEQLVGVGDNLFTYLQACHHSENCIIWDFSHFNFEWCKKRNISDSVMLLPLMIQSRLTQGQEDFPVQPLSNRSLDVVFFAFMLPRRRLLKQSILKSRPNWNMIFGMNSANTFQIKSYRNAKVCLVAHAYNETSAGEYHRLSEFATSGCVPVMEEFADTLATDDYAQCGGVVFARYDDLIDNITFVLKEISEGKRDNRKYIEWWQRGIQWENVLLRLFGERQTT